MPVGALAERAAARHRDRTAVVGPDGDRTFAQLHDTALRLANGLLAAGLRPGDRVLELLPNSCATLESDLALALAGLVRVPLNPRLGAREWERIADDCGASALVYGASFTDESEALRTGLGEGRVVAAGDGPGLSLRDLVAHSPARRLAPVADGSLAGLAYSSGTTGRPKGALRTHRNRLASARAMTDSVLGGSPRPDSVFLHAGPLMHTSGLFFLPFLAAGACQILLDHADAESIVETVHDRRVTHTVLVPTMVARLLSLAGSPRARLSALRMLAYAGAPMPTDHIRAASELLTPHLVQYYGLVEAMPPLTWLTSEDHAHGLAERPELLTSAGRPAPGVSLRIVDEEDAEVPDGRPGEVEVRGDMVMPGYWNAERRGDLGKVLRGGRLRTGDIGRLGEDGLLWLTDRVNDMIITGGYNVYPREVEDSVTGLDGVTAAAVVGLPDPEWGQRVAVAYTCAPGLDVSSAAVLSHCRSVLPPHKRPKAAHRLAVMPLNATGKISRRAVRDLLGEPGPGRSGRGTAQGA
ncbi:class I adenylate-forming enzyme family protein [Streptomyces sp. 3214.6]|uniref:class I adenylate-forming enzyme family protein n=1 Tax=Streptomyces sp. 3214.6 TaxID=1882757 RepID=UPI00090B908D|nr:AMP-binding protein [Streptomyces sp. 3214.6]SHI26110.1 Acyl-CoA synthetase (AMP-forming)/AMP-acid ligase II [Streptomyces sp. 3214.6]